MECEKSDGQDRTLAAPWFRYGGRSVRAEPRRCALSYGKQRGVAEREQGGATGGPLVGEPTDEYFCRSTYIVALKERVVAMSAGGMRSLAVTGERRGVELGERSARVYVVA